MNNKLTLTTEFEQMVNAQQASSTLSLPYYWFSDSAMRTAKQLPHYRLGGTIRFRVSELAVWAENVAGIRQAREEQ